MSKPEVVRPKTLRSVNFRLVEYSELEEMSCERATIRENDTFGHQTTPSSEAFAQSITTTPLSRKTKKYEFNYFYYNPPLYDYVWPRKTKFIKPVPCSRQITQNIVKTPEGSHKAVISKSKKQTTIKSMPIYTAQPLNPAVKNKRDVAIPYTSSMVQTTQPSLVNLCKPRSIKKTFRFTTVPDETSLPSPQIPVPHITPIHCAAFAKASSTSKVADRSHSIFASVRQPALSTPVPRAQVLDADASNVTVPVSVQPPLKFLVAPMKGHSQKLKEITVSQVETKMSKRDPPSFDILTNIQRQLMQPVQAKLPAQMALRKGYQLMPQAKQLQLPTAAQPVNLTRGMPSSIPNRTLVVNERTNVIPPKRSVIVEGSSKRVPVLFEQLKPTQSGNAIQADIIPASTSHISTASGGDEASFSWTARSLSGTDYSGLQRTWKTVIMRSPEHQRPQGNVLKKKVIHPPEYQRSPDPLYFLIE